MDDSSCFNNKFIMIFVRLVPVQVPSLSDDCAGIGNFSHVELRDCNWEYCF